LKTGADFRERRKVSGRKGCVPLRSNGGGARASALEPAGRRSLRARLRKRFLQAACALLLLSILGGAAFYMCAKLLPFPEDLLRSISFSTVVVDSEGNLLQVFPNEEGDFVIPVTLRQVSPYVVQATCAIEDRRFWSHPGVDLKAVLRAAWQNLTSGRIVSGASTITQQVVRLLEPRPRTVWTKIAEAFRALQLESALSKREILSLYLTLAPYGGNLYGIEAAARAYLGKSAAGLTLPEAALLAGLPQAPSRLRPDRYPRRALERRNLVLKAMAREGYVTPEEIEPYLFEADERPPKFERFPLPVRAPHFCRLVRFLHPQSSLIKTTLHLSLQQYVERLLKERTADLPGVNNAACIVVENATGAVRAYVGSTDFWDSEHGGQIDGVRAFRSPGSTLKPFLYAKLFDKRLLAPEEILPDVPLLASAWRPDNFDRRSHGLIPAGRALAKSYNLTAVRLLARFGLNRFAVFLADAGVLRSENKRWGLSLILGAPAVRLIDLVRVYCALARFGRPIPLLLTTGEGEPSGVPLLLGEEESERFSFTPEACFLVAEALTRAPVAAGGPLGYAWKTGTSWGRRDAWTVAYTPKYTVGVWFGNFSGEPAEALVGQEAAAPCALEILARIDPNPKWPAEPAEIEEAVLCASTGLRAGAFCPKKVRGRVLKGDRRKCNVHRRFPVDAQTGSLLCRSCLQGRDFIWRVFEIWPPDVEAYLEANGKKPLPPHLHSCKSVTAAGTLCFVSPKTGGKYFLRDSILPVEVLSPSQQVSFFLDGRFLGRRPRRFALPVRPSRHHLSCVDRRGQVASVTFECIGK